MRRTSGLFLSIPILLSLAACSPLAALLGYNGPAIQVAAQLDQAKLVADGVSFVGSGKTVTDHVISAATGSDCKLINVLDKAPVCISENTRKSSALETN